jgi:hypothetical protein
VRQRINGKTGHHCKFATMRNGEFSAYGGDSIVFAESGCRSYQGLVSKWHK